MEYEIICTFNEYEQIVIHLCYNPDVSEEKFINEIFNMLHIKELKQLVKLSCDQLYISNYIKLLPFIQKNNGKYYFNEDPETSYWHDFRNEYLKNKIKRRSRRRKINILGGVSLLIGLFFLSKKNKNSKKIKDYESTSIEETPIYKRRPLYPYYSHSHWNVIL